jgi:hypothetical protein
MSERPLEYWMPRLKRGMTAERNASASSRRARPSHAGNDTLVEQPRAQGRPGARCTHGPRAKECLRVRALTTGTGGITPAFPAQWFTAYFALSPVNQLVATVIVDKAHASFDDLAPAWARQDHTTWPSAKAAARQSAASRPPHPAPRS